MLGGSSPHINPATQKYFSGVVTAGGTYSSQRFARLNRFFGEYVSSGLWDRLDDGWLQVAENREQALVSIKQARLGVEVAGPIPFTIDRGFTYNGTSQLVNTGFTPSLHCVVATSSSMRMAVYERVNLASSGFAAGSSGSLNNCHFRLDPRGASGIFTGNLNSTQVNSAGVTDSRGYSAVSRSGLVATPPVYKHFKNGAILTTAAVATTIDNALPEQPIVIGARMQGIGTPADFRATNLGFVLIGGHLTDAQELAEYNLIQGLMTDLGAQV